MRQLILTGAALALLAGPAMAQDYSLDPAFGSASLEVGFTPDPFTVDITSGGSINARNLGGNCRGWVANAPDFSIYYTAGSLDLTIGSTSDSDTTLVVNGPNGNWYCDDDSGDGLNPLMTFANPGSGRYDIWIGSYNEGDYAAARLSVSELGRSGGGSASGGPDFTQPAIFGNASLRTGFQPDPYRIDIVSGGVHRASSVRSGCAGWVAGAPDFQLEFAAGSLPLIISAASDSDTTLLVNDPNGNWHCDDDGGNAGLNPALTFNNAASGVYDIWIGSYSEGNNASATLSISELYSE